MKQLKLPLLAMSVISSLSAMNGTNLVGNDTVTSSMGGSGVAMNSDLNLGTLNPALVSGNHFSVGVRDFVPTVRTNGDGTDDFINSENEKTFVPSIGITHDMIPGVSSIGFNVYGATGTMLDYSNDEEIDINGNFMTQSGTKQLKTFFRSSKFTVPMKLAFNDYLTVGIAPVVQHGELGISYNDDGVVKNGNTSKDYGAGYEIGATSDLHTKNIVLGVNYKSKIELSYDGQISGITKKLGISNGNGLSDTLEQPSELVIGASYTFYADNVKSTFTLDYKNIGWDEAKGYKELGWKDQDVFAVGYEFDSQERISVRLGYSYATDAIMEQEASSNEDGHYDGAAINYFNLIALPGTIKNHFSIGMGWKFSDNVILNASYMYSPEVVTSFDTSAMTQEITNDPTAKSSVITTNTQNTTALNLVFKF